MKTLNATGPLLIAVKSSVMQGVKPGTVQVQCVRYETYEIPLAEFDAMTFQIHDATRPEARIIAELVKL